MKRLRETDKGVGGSLNYQEIHKRIMNNSSHFKDKEIVYDCCLSEYFEELISLEIIVIE